MEILRKGYTDDGVHVTAIAPILLIYSDRGPDHRITYESVNLSLIVLQAP